MVPCNFSHHMPSGGCKLLNDSECHFKHYFPVSRMTLIMSCILHVLLLSATADTVRNPYLKILGIPLPALCMAWSFCSLSVVDSLSFVVDPVDSVLSSTCSVWLLTDRFFHMNTCILGILKYHVTITDS